MRPEVEEYLEAIYRMELQGIKLARNTVLAKEVGVTPGTVSTVVKRMQRDNLVINEPYKGIRLTTKGRKVGKKILESHLVFGKFLTEVLGMSKKKACEEACKLEHAVSKETIKRLKVYMASTKKRSRKGILECS